MTVCKQPVATLALNATSTYVSMIRVLGGHLLAPDLSFRLTEYPLRFDLMEKLRRRSALAFDDSSIRVTSGSRRVRSTFVQYKTPSSPHSRLHDQLALGHSGSQSTRFALI
ncbi:MAG: hypothetical protein J5534_13525 [Fibrobacter sp.]|nr:hypothetical protein [Fibrobacter sp.]